MADKPTILDFVKPPLEGKDYLIYQVPPAQTLPIEILPETP